MYILLLVLLLLLLLLVSLLILYHYSYMYMSMYSCMYDPRKADPVPAHRDIYIYIYIHYDLRQFIDSDKIYCKKKNNYGSINQNILRPIHSLYSFRYVLYVYV